MKDNVLGKNLKALRDIEKISQKKLAQALHIENTRISKWERGLLEPDLDTLKALAKYFSVTIDDLLNEV